MAENGSIKWENVTDYHCFADNFTNCSMPREEVYMSRDVQAWLE